MNKNTFQKIEDLINKSNLEKEEIRDFIELFAQTKEDALRPVLRLLERDISWVERLYNNYKMKEEAIITGSMEAWHDAIKNEKEELR